VRLSVELSDPPVRTPILRVERGAFRGAAGPDSLHVSEKEMGAHTGPVAAGLRHGAQYSFHGGATVGLRRIRKDRLSQGGQASRNGVTVPRTGIEKDILRLGFRQERVGLGGR
jgi:hypothetical protein